MTSHLGPVERITAEAGHGAPLGANVADADPWLPWAGPVLLVSAGLSLGLVLLNPFIALPVALVAGVTAAIATRRHPPARVLFEAAVAVSVLTLVVGVIAASFLFASGAGELAASPPVQVTGK